MLRLKVFLVLLTYLAWVPVFHATAIELKIPGLRYGGLERSREVTELFETYKILPDHSYYINGVGSVPYAIIGIQKKYELREGLWEKIDISPQMLRGWLYQMDMVYGYRPYGSWIVDENGQKIGIWYSSKQRTTVLVESDNRVAVFTPEPPGFRSGR
jgi:hypothetical protein